MATEISYLQPSSVPASYDGFEKQYIGGKWRTGRSGQLSPDTNPFNGDVLARIPLADKSDVDDAYKCAAEAQRSWAHTLPGERARVLRKAAAIMEARENEIKDWIVRESGGTRLKADFEFGITLAITYEASSFPSRVSGRILPADIPGKEGRVYRQPLGVVGVISPWNFPLNLSHRSVAPAIALGNAVVLKPASDTPVTGGLLLAKIFEEAGLPPGVLNVVVGSGSTIGDEIVSHPIPRLISFTGSTEVGKRLAELAAKSPMLKKLALELGGNGPLVILDDADIDLAVRAATFGKFMHQGQICMITNRIVVDEKVHDEFLDKYVERVRGLKCGDPREPDTVIGPIINKRQLEGLLKEIETARKQGAREVLGGEPKGQVLPPHIFADANMQMDVARKEMFGPVVSVIKVHGEDEALSVANDTHYGLSSAVFTRDLERGVEFARKVQAGMTHVNDSPVNDLPNNPFGGEKNSGLGRFGGEWIMDEMTTDHWITVQHKPVDYPF